MVNFIKYIKNYFPFICRMFWVDSNHCCLFLTLQESQITIKDKSGLPNLRNPEILIGENDLTSLSYLNEPEGRAWVLCRV